MNKPVSVAISRPTPQSRTSFRHFESMSVRWMDCDMFGHVNNVTYYSYFDTAINAYLVRAGALDPLKGQVIGLVAETGCHYFSPLLFPSVLDIGLKVVHVGRSSVCYEPAVFRKGEAVSCAHGRFVHVYVDRVTLRPISLTPELRDAILPLAVGTAQHGERS